MSLSISKTRPLNPPAPPISTAASQAIQKALEHYDRGARNMRKGICLLNAGRFAEAEQAFKKAQEIGASSQALPAYLAAALLGQNQRDQAFEQLSRVSTNDSAWPSARIRQALALRESGQHEKSVRLLRDAIGETPECAELHFQLGILLAASECYDEAELRFTQAINIAPDHTEALVSLALCCAARYATGAAMTFLQRAQARKPHDARIGLLLAQAAKAQQQRGQRLHLQAKMIDERPPVDPSDLEQLTRILQKDSDFVDAFLSLKSDVVDDYTYAILLKTLENALEHQPEQAELHFHCGQVLSRLGLNDQAIEATEQALELNPRYVRAMVELGKLYAQSNRAGDAMARLEAAVEAGAEYADVFFLLGNLYRDHGRVPQAKQAYQKALKLNHLYQPAQQALKSLAGPLPQPSSLSRTD